MVKMTVIHLGVIVFAICLSTQQVVSKNSTETMGNGTVSNVTTATGTYSSSASTPVGAGVSLQSGPFSVLLPVFMAAPLLHHYC